MLVWKNILGVFSIIRWSVGRGRNWGEQGVGGAVRVAVSVGEGKVRGQESGMRVLRKNG